MKQPTHDLTMPAFGADMATGTLIEWQVKEGDHVKRGDVIAVVETNKGAIELDIFEDTVIDKLLVKVGEEIRVGTSIARLIGPPLQSTQKDQTESLNTEKLPEDEAQPPIRIATPADNLEKQDAFVLASPAARQWAKENQLDLSQLANKKKAPITLKDVLAPNKRPENINKSQGETKQMMRQAISDTVSLSKQTIPHYYLSHRLDVTALKNHLSNYNQDKEAESRILLAAPVLIAIARTLVKHQQLNGQYINQKFIPQSPVHLAHAVNIRGSGLIMPVIHDAQSLDVTTIMQTITQQVTQARRGRLPMSQLTQATCCVTNIGERGAEQMWPIIQPPQVAIIALGSPHQEALVIENQVQIRDVITATLAADHRVSDGHIGAKFLYQLNLLLQLPESLWTENR